ncbi:MAG: ABC transporter permease [Chloroflexota bacterium]|nr:ABC transporter permease [Chloroflexota bacterium]
MASARQSRRPSLLASVFQARLAWFGGLILGLVLFLAVTADVLTPYDPNFQDYGAVLQPPSAAHLFGTDEIGRDIYARVIYGSRVSLQVGAISVGIAVFAGVLVGLLAGHYGGWVDEVLMRGMDALQAFPGLVLALAIAAMLGPGIGNAMIAIGIVSMPVFARLVHGQALSVRENDFVMAARVAGAGAPRIMFHHIWPNVTGPIIVQASLACAYAILTEASLSFLGIGVRPPTAAWGSMLRTAYQYLTSAPWLSIFPGVALFLTVVAFNVLGDGLRQALDPRLRGRGHS